MYTFGFLALQVQDVAPLAGSGGLLEILRETGPLNQAVLAILILFSIVSWAIILFKTISYGRVARQTATFLDVFRRSQKFSEVQAICPLSWAASVTPLKFCASRTACTRSPTVG